MDISAPLLRSPPPSRVASYDFMRGVAISGVILAHVSESFSTGNSRFDLVETFGRFGVQLFFFVSALTMCLMWERRGAEKHQARNFYIRRFLRIAPLFWLAMLVYYNQSMTALQVFLTAIFLHGLSPSAINAVVPGGWSISVEMMFYAIFPIIIVRLPRRSDIYLALGFAAYLGNAFVFSPVVSGAYGSYFGIDPKSMKDFLYMNFFHQFPIFTLGCAVYFWKPARPNMLAIAFIAAWFSVSLSRRLLGVDASMEHMTLVALAMFPAVLLAHGAEPLSLISRFLSRLGENSYAIYLSHFLVIAALARMFDLAGLAKIGYLPNLGAFLVTGAVSYVVAVCLHKMIERPAHRLAERLVESSEKAGGNGLREAPPTKPGHSPACEAKL